MSVALWAVVGIMGGALITILADHVIIPRVEARKQRKREKQTKIATPKDLLDAADELSSLISSPEQRYRPDYILGIDGGGCVIAALLGQRLNKPTIQFAADRKTNLKNPQFPRDQDFFEKLKLIIKDEKILLVDDLSNTSNTLENAKSTLQSIVGDIKIAVISKPDRRIASERGIDLSLYDYSVLKFDHKGPHTVEFPWNVWP